MGFKSLGRNVKISTKASIYDPEQITLSDHVRVDDFAMLSGKVSLGWYVHIGAYSLLAGGQAGITFEEWSGVAYRVSVFAQSDDYTGAALATPEVPSRYRKESKKPVLVKKHAAIATGSIVLPGVTIAEGSIICAMSLVRKSTESWTIYQGDPLRRLGARKKDILQREEQFLRDRSAGRGTSL